MSSNDDWLAVMWPFVRDHIPSPPATVLEIGCGSLGGFVPSLLDAGYDAVGVDPEAPEGPAFRRTTFERYEIPSELDAVVASSSLHHVPDLGEVFTRVDAVLAAEGKVVVFEWAWERFDEATAQWCFARLPAEDPDDESGWLRRHRDNWRESGLPWGEHLQAWARQEGLHPGGQVLQELEMRFEPIEKSGFGPYCFRALPEVSRADELLAIERAEIEATGIEFVGRSRKRDSR